MEVEFVEMARWQHRAACRGTDPEIFHPRSSSERQTAPRNAVFSPNLALRICAGCVVRAACLEYAVTAPVHPGIWGGMTANERAVYRRARNELDVMRQQRRLQNG